MDRLVVTVYPVQHHSNQEKSIDVVICGRSGRGTNVSGMSDNQMRGAGAGAGVAIGAGIGAALLAATGNAVWLAVGVAIGAAVGTAVSQVNSHENDDDPPT